MTRKVTFIVVGLDPKTNEVVHLKQEHEVTIDPQKEMTITFPDGNRVSVTGIAYNMGGHQVLATCVTEHIEDFKEEAGWIESLRSHTSPLRTALRHIAAS